MEQLIRNQQVQPPAPGATSDDDLAAFVSTLHAKIKVVGCGGGGSNTIMRLTQANVEGCEMIACNTDAQHLLNIRVPNKLLIGRRTTRGLGAGALPQIGEQSALEAEADVRKFLEGADMVFVTAGMGGGTGTGSAPAIAKMAREMGALTIAVVTMPFRVEGAVRMENAQAGLARLRENADTTIVIPNDKLLEIAPRLPLQAAFKLADEVLIRSIRGLTEMITKPGLVNLDFADLQTVMRRGGVAMIGLGESDGENRARDAVEEALSSPLLDVDISNASGCLVEVVGGNDMTLQEAQEVVQTIHERIGPDARIIWGANVNPQQGRSIKVMLVVTGVKSRQILGQTAGARATASSPPSQPPARGSAPRPPGDVDFVI
ncbi:MAG TPA: cell division protein FtsZ [Candidatus Thermoplasmatota archaeon]|nr:cell division protein FtsZ [Candidatus Thermoplasmatota archaeon]